MANKLIVSAAPHITSADSTSKIMGRVCIALLPTLIASVLIFGFQALLLTAVTVAACVVFEYAYCKLVGRDVTISDLSAVVTGLLLAFNLPAGLPVWMSLVGAFIAIVIIKQLFGGLGYNFANPAIVGRIAMALGFTGALAATNSATAPVIKAAEEAAAQAARTELLPEATGFTLVEGEFEGVTEIYTADNGVGTIITSSDKGYSSTVVVMVAFDPDGTIKQVKIQSQGETAGVGTKIENESFWSQYTGLPAETITLDQQVDRITGASISSSAVNDAVNFAIAAYNAIS